MTYWLILKKTFVNGILLNNSYRYLEDKTGIPRSTLQRYLPTFIYKGWVTKKGKRLIVKSYEDVYNDKLKNRKVYGSTPKEILESMRFVCMRHEESRQYMAYKARCGDTKGRFTVFSCTSLSCLDASPNFTISYKAIAVMFSLSRSGAMRVIDNMVREGKISRGHVWKYCYPISYSDFVCADFDRRYYWNKGNLYQQLPNHYSTKGLDVGTSIPKAWIANMRYHKAIAKAS